MLALDATIKSAVQRLGVAKAGDCGELREGHFSPVVVNSNATPSVIRLLAGSGPFHIPRLIIAVVIYALKRMLRARARSYVREERREVIQPALADPNSPATIPMKKRITRVAATVLHSSPSAILGRSVRLPMSFAGLRSARLLQTAAALGVPSQKVAGKSNGLTTALALAVPASLSSRTILRPAGYDQSPEGGSR